MAQIRIQWPQGTITATLRETPTASLLLEALPHEGTANTWGDEVYFSMPFSAQAEADARDVVEQGAVCFWLAGDALALLFGPTPVSQNGECRLISEANVVGQMDGDLNILRTVCDGDTITLERA